MLAIVVIGHWVAALWVERNRATLNPTDSQRVPVQVALLTPERIERKPAGAVPRPVTARSTDKPAARPAAPREHVLTATRAGTEPAAVAVAASAASAAVASDASAAAGSAASAPSAASATPPVAASVPATPGVKFTVPPSGELQYDTFYNGVRNQPGTIHWTSNGQTYEMVVSVPLPFVGTFSYSSHGHIDAFGLAPDQYIEKRGHRAENVSIFNRVTRQIAFTRTPASLPLPDGAQDRFSMVMQLASLVRGDPAAYKPGVTRQFFVVDSDSAETWPIETIGDETIRTAQGYLATRHFKRLPRRDGDQRRIDVWLAPSLGWLPARIMQTEPNGTQVELVWRGALNVEAIDRSATPPVGVGVNANSTSSTDANADSASEPATASSAQSGVAPPPSADPAAPSDKP